MVNRSHDGGQQAEIQADEIVAAPDWLGEPVEEQAQLQPVEEPAAPESLAARPRSTGIRLLGILLILLALGWVGAAGWTMWQTRPALARQCVAWIATVAGPLALLALLWLMFGRTSRREAESQSAVEAIPPRAGRWKACSRSSPAGSRTITPGCAARRSG